MDDYDMEKSTPSLEAGGRVLLRPVLEGWLMPVVNLYKKRLS